jgi:glycosyltransferase involved in cell wall biosynthesis
MKVVMTLMVRNEADIIDRQIAFHLAAGVDFVVAMDHGSTDETTEILESYETSGVLHLLRVSSPTKQKSARYTRMARMAATEFGADWVINSDADEFWLPSGGSLKDVLSQIPERFGVVRTFVRPFLPRPGSGPFAERMTVRFAPSAPINNPSDPFRVNVRLLHRADGMITVGGGNASVRTSLSPLQGWSPIEVLHFPIRSFPQFERKFLTHYETSAGERQRGEHVRAYEAARTGKLEQLYEQLCVDDRQLDRGLAARTLELDTRLRDALRGLDNSQLQFHNREGVAESGYAVDADVLVAGETVRLQRRTDELLQRVRNLEQRSHPSLRRAI